MTEETIDAKAQSTDTARAERLMRSATVAALAVAVALFLAKGAAWLATGSVALFGSLIDSGLDILATGFNFVAVRHALQPADHEHRFGHGKAEALAGLIQGAFIGGSAVFLFAQSVARVLSPEPVEATALGIGVTLVSIVATFALVSYQSYVIRHTKSLAISADELHYRSDLLLNAAVIVALVLAGPLFGWGLADPMIGGAIAIYIAWSAFEIVRRAYDQLMDREFTDGERADIVRIATAHPKVIALHDLRTRRSGRDAFIQLHLELDPSMRLVEAHEIADDVEVAIQGAFPEAEVIIHQDPAGIAEDHSDIALSEQMAQPA